MKSLAEHFTTGKVEMIDPDLNYLSSREQAQANITSALIDNWDRLDGSQQRAILMALHGSTEDTEKAEKWARDRIS